MRILLATAFLVTPVMAWAQSPEGRTVFQTLCSGCHGTDGNGGEHAPSIMPALAAKNDVEITAIVREGVPRKGMPAFKQLPDADLGALLAHMRAIQPRRGGRRGMPVRLKVTLTDGKELEGLSLARTG